MKVFTALFLGALAGSALAQNLAGMDRTERTTNLGESPTERMTGRTFTFTPNYSYLSGQDVIVSGPGVRVGFNPRNGLGRTVASYRYDTITESGFGHQIRDLFVVNVQLTPDSFPVTLTGTYTNDNLRNASRITGWGGTLSKSFRFAEGQNLELSVTGTNERFSFPAAPPGSFVQEGTVWDAAASMFYEGGVGLTFDYVFKSDFEGSSSWFVQAAFPLGKLSSRFIVGQGNVSGFQVGWKF